VASPLVDAVGVAAALCSMTSFAPQIVKLVKTRDASGVSLRTYAVTVTGFALWIAYGVLLGSWPVAVSNTVCLLMSAAVLVLKWRYDPAPRARPRS
jgi:MtN3 and saliva related transmembrane protein